MERLEVGEIATLDNGKEYIVFSKTVEDGVDYVYLMSNFKPLEIKFAEQYEKDGNIELKLVSDQKEKQRLLYLFQNKNN